MRSWALGRFWLQDLEAAMTQREVAINRPASDVPQLHTGRKSDRLEEVGDGRAAGSSAIGDGGRVVVVSLTPDMGGTGSHSLLEPAAQSHL